jgi:hypothetical protein
MLIRRWRCKGWGEVGIESVLRNRGEAAIRAEGKRPSEQRRSDIKIAGVMVSERGKEEKREERRKGTASATTSLHYNCTSIPSFDYF